MTGRWGGSAGAVALAATLALPLASCQPGASSPASGRPARAWPGVSAAAKLPDDRVVVGQTVLVPIHSSLATADNGRSINLATTLTVRNADPNRPIVVEGIRYHDSGGKLVRSFLDTPVRVEPLAAIDLFVGESDTTGGSTPSFLVDWAADAEVAPALVEAVMVSTAGAQGITLTGAGRVVAQRHR